jgi:hypothetical protein
MDPLSISASIIALLQATTTVLSICYDFRACIKNAPWSLTTVVDEIKSLRNIIETLEQLFQTDVNTFSKRQPIFELLCDPENGPLVSCERELLYLEEKIIAPSMCLLPQVILPFVPNATHPDFQSILHRASAKSDIHS